MWILTKQKNTERWQGTNMRINMAITFHHTDPKTGTRKVIELGG